MEIDSSLIAACKKRNRKAQFELYRECFGLLMGVCLRYKKNKEDAEEILNQGFLKVLLNLDKYQPSIPFTSWIRRIMINTIIDEFRKEKRERENIQQSFDDGDVSGAPVHLNDADLNYNAEELINLIQQLPTVSQKVFNLYAIDGYAHKEIAQLLNISEGTSKWHVSFARKELKKKLEIQLNLAHKNG